MFYCTERTLKLAQGHRYGAPLRFVKERCRRLRLNELSAGPPGLFALRFSLHRSSPISLTFTI